MDISRDVIFSQSDRRKAGPCRGLGAYFLRYGYGVSLTVVRADINTCLCAGELVSMTAFQQTVANFLFVTVSQLCASFISFVGRVATRNGVPIADACRDSLQTGKPCLLRFPHSSMSQPRVCSVCLQMKSRRNDLELKMDLWRRGGSFSVAAGKATQRDFPASSWLQTTPKQGQWQHAGCLPPPPIRQPLCPWPATAHCSSPKSPCPTLGSCLSSGHPP